MKRENETTAKLQVPFWKGLLFPNRASLRVPLRITVGIVANIILGKWVIPKLAMTRWEAVDLMLMAVPLFAITTLLPVICFGRDVPRLLAIGLCFLPSYIFINMCIVVMQMAIK